MNGNGRLRTKTPDVAGSFSELTHDVIELSELQAKLFVLDIKKSSQRTRTCVVLGVVAICFLLGSIPVVLAALAQVFVEQLQWSQSAALGVAALLGVALAAIAAGAAWGMIQGGLLSLRRSREELSRNMDWLKSTLRDRGQPTGGKPGR